MKKLVLLFIFSFTSQSAIMERCETDNFKGPKVDLVRLSQEQIEAHIEGGEVIDLFSWRETEKGTVYFGEKFFFEVYYKLGSKPVSFVPASGYFFRGIMYLRGEVTTVFCRD